MEPSKKPIKKLLDEMYGVTDEEIDGIILEQKIEEEEEKIKVLKELVGYKSFEDYLADHEKEFDIVEITDDFKMIIIPENIYSEIHLDVIRKIKIVADHFGIFICLAHAEKEKIARKRNEI